MKIKNPSKIFILIILFCICKNVSITYSSEKDMITEIINLNIDKLNAALKEITDNKNPYALTEILDENGNVAAYKYYLNHIRSRSIKELKTYDNKIFMGLGDWTDNTGPVKVLYYDVKTNKILTSGTIDDEAIQSFNVIDGKLYTTGTDPKEASYGKGSYYMYDNINNLFV